MIVLSLNKRLLLHEIKYKKQKLFGDEEAGIEVRKYHNEYIRFVVD